jgi:hypothetical protein
MFIVLIIVIVVLAIWIWELIQSAKKADAFYKRHVKALETELDRQIAMVKSYEDTLDYTFKAIEDGRVTKNDIPNVVQESNGDKKPDGLNNIPDEMRLMQILKDANIPFEFFEDKNLTHVTITASASDKYVTVTFEDGKFSYSN